MNLKDEVLAADYERALVLVQEVNFYSNRDNVKAAAAHRKLTHLVIKKQEYDLSENLRASLKRRGVVFSSKPEVPPELIQEAVFWGIDSQIESLKKEIVYVVDPNFPAELKPEIPALVRKYEKIVETLNYVFSHFDEVSFDKLHMEAGCLEEAIFHLKSKSGEGCSNEKSAIGQIAFAKLQRN